MHTGAESNQTLEQSPLDDGNLLPSTTNNSDQPTVEDGYLVPQIVPSTNTGGTVKSTVENELTDSTADGK